MKLIKYLIGILLVMILGIIALQKWYSIQSKKHANAACNLAVKGEKIEQTLKKLHNQNIKYIVLEDKKNGDTIFVNGDSFFYESYSCFISTHQGMVKKAAVSLFD